MAMVGGTVYAQKHPLKFSGTEIYRGGDVPASHQRRELNKKGSACAAQDSTALRMEDVTGRKTNIPKAASQTE